MTRYVKINTVLGWLKIIAEAKSYTVKRALCHEYAKILQNPQHTQEFDGIISDVAEVKHGEWVHSNRGFNVPGDYECSICHSPSGVKHFYNGDKYTYCPDCGAKMDGEMKST